MDYKLSEQELQDLMHRCWLKAKKFYNGKTDEYFYDHFESEKKQLLIHSVVVSDCLGVKVDKSKATHKVEIRDTVFRKGSSLNNN